VGSGKVGIVLANTSDGHICDWVLDDSALMAGFASRGYRVLLFEWRAAAGAGYIGRKIEAAQARDTSAAADEIRSLGSSMVVLGGASIGGVTALEAAATLKPAPDAVFGFSSSTDNAAAVTAVLHRLNVPLLFVAATGDPNTGQTKSLYRSATTKAKKLILVSGQTHGFFDLNPSAKNVDAAVLAFIAKYT
jgi:alpha-beta hydrolase superfamily lysophospholipase